MILILYLIGVIIVSITAWKMIFNEHDDDPLMAGIGLMISVCIGLIWPVFVAISPFMGLLWLVGKR